MGHNERSPELLEVLPLAAHCGRCKILIFDEVPSVYRYLFPKDRPEDVVKRHTSHGGHCVECLPFIEN